MQNQLLTKGHKINQLINKVHGGKKQQNKDIDDTLVDLFLEKTISFASKRKSNIKWTVINKFLMDNPELQTFIAQNQIQDAQFTYICSIDTGSQVINTDLTTKQKIVQTIEARYRYQYNSDLSIEVQRFQNTKTNTFAESTIQKMLVMKIYYIPKERLFLDYVFDITQDQKNSRHYLERLKIEECQYVNIRREHRFDKIDVEGIKQTFFRALSSVIYIDPYKNLIYNIAKQTIFDQKRRLTVRQLRDVTAKVITLDKNIYNKIYPPFEYFLTKKIDGEHIVLFNQRISNDQFILTILSESQIIYEYKSSYNVHFVLEGELVININSKINIYLLDIMSYDQKEKVWPRTEQRLIQLVDWAKIVTKILQDNNSELQVKTKEFIKILDKEQMKSSIAKLLSQKDEKIDGLLFIAPNKEYLRTKIYKWKPFERQTIDFLAMKHTSGKLKEDEKNKNEYILLTTTTYDTFQNMAYQTLPSYTNFLEEIIKEKKFKSSNTIPIHFQPFLHKSENDHIFICEENVHMKVVELLYHGGKWNLLKIRDDKQALVNERVYFGNNHYIAEQIWNTLNNPLSAEELVDYQPTGYFGKGKELQYAESTKYHSVVKMQIYKSFIPPSATILDIGCGKGQDLWKYLNLKVRNAIFNDVDHLALTQLIQRRYEMKFEKNSVMKSKIVPGDIREIHVKDQILEYIGKGNVDCIICAYSLHYYLQNLKNLVLFFSKLLQDNGYVIIIGMDGNTIHNEFLQKQIKNGEKLVFQEIDGKLKYSIRRLYDEDELSNGQQKIAVKLPFQEYEVEEFIMDKKYIVNEMKKQGLKLLIDQQFAEFGEENQIQEYLNLSAIDQEYTSYNMYMVFQNTLTLQKNETKNEPKNETKKQMRK